MTVAPGAGAQQHACTSCGAALEFAPGTAGLRCPYCGAVQPVSAVPAAVADLRRDYRAYAQQPGPPVAQLPPFRLDCRGCGSSTETTAVSSRCPSCAAPLVALDDLGGQLLPADAVVPFVVDQQAALVSFRAWTSSRWFAPGSLKKVGTTSSLRGGYVPHWGFDDDTVTDYTGQRGEHYYTTESHTTTENGRSVTRTRQVRHTRWWPASGQVSRAFRDVLATAASVPAADDLRELGPWSVDQATTFDPGYLAGVDVPRYDLDPAVGWDDAARQMAEVIEQDCRADIGGDEQRLDAMQTDDRDVLFRLLLLPLWFASYVTGGVDYRVFINANTGEVVGDRPYSRVKIALAVLAVLVLASVAFLLYAGQR